MRITTHNPRTTPRITNCITSLPKCSEIEENKNLRIIAVQAEAQGRETGTGTGRTTGQAQSRDKHRAEAKTVAGQGERQGWTAIWTGQRRAYPPHISCA